MILGYSGLDKLSPLNSVELYHPSKHLHHVEIPDVPHFMEDISGFWIDGNLWICGKTTIDTCYILRKDKHKFSWEFYPDPMRFMKSSSANLFRPKQSWMLYSIGKALVNVKV